MKRHLGVYVTRVHPATWQTGCGRTLPEGHVTLEPDEATCRVCAHGVWAAQIKAWASGTRETPDWRVNSIAFHKARP